MSKNIVFIDSRVTGFETLLGSLPADCECVLLNTEEDGIEQIRGALQGWSDLQSIQIVSHGNAGRVLIGSGELSAATLTNYTDALSEIASKLASDGDIILYGCNVGAGVTGAMFIEDLYRLTGADIAASDDATGKAAIGGDWVLERQVGTVEAQAPISLAQLPELLS